MVQRSSDDNTPWEHELKCWPKYYGAIALGDKTFEVRKWDRPYRVGDTLLLRCWDNKTQEYTGREMRRRITYLLDMAYLPGDNIPHFAGYVVMGLGHTEDFVSESIDKLYGLVSDINTEEITHQISQDALSKWCNSWRMAAKDILNDMYRERKEHTTDSLLLELATTKEQVKEMKKHVQAAIQDMEFIVAGGRHCDRCDHFAKCDRPDSATCDYFDWYGPNNGPESSADQRSDL